LHLPYFSNHQEGHPSRRHTKKRSQSFVSLEMTYELFLFRVFHTTILKAILERGIFVSSHS
jgi:hypothetical protein